MIFYYFSQNESIISKMGTCISKRSNRNTRVFYDGRDIGGFLEVTLLWIDPIHQNVYRAQWLRVGNNIDYRDNRFV